MDMLTEYVIKNIYQRFNANGMGYLMNSTISVYKYMLALCFVFFLASCLSARAGTYGALTYQINGSEVFITDCSQSVSGALTIPSQIEGLPVTTIDYDAFDYCSSLTGITIPSGVTSIKSFAFSYCPALSNVSLPSSLTSIGAYAFIGCTSLASITLPEGLLNLDSLAFRACPLTSIAIPSTLTSIGSISPFWDCFGLVSIDVAIGNTNFTSVDGVLFNSAQTKLIAYPAAKAGTTYSILGSVTTIGEAAFSGCKNLTDITIPGRLGSIGRYTFLHATSLEHVTLEEGLTLIGEQAFLGCSSVVDLPLPSSLVSIDDFAFTECSSLTNLTLPASLSSFGDSPRFNGCDHLLSVDVAAGNLHFSSVDGVLFNKSQTKLIGYPAGRSGNYTIPEGVTTIGRYAFVGCRSLTGIYFPSGVTSIEDEAFGLCTALTGFIFPAGLSSIGGYAFYDCDALNNIVFMGDAPSVGANLFWGVGSSYTIYYLPTSSGFSSPSWEGYPAKVLPVQFELDGDAVTITGSYTNVAGAITIPAKIGSGLVTAVGPAAFYDCSSVSSISIPSGVVNIDNSAFGGCSSLISIVVSVSNSEYSSAGGVLFSKDKAELIAYPMGKSDVVYSIPTTVTDIVSRAFSDCASLTSVTLPNGLSALDEYAFENCTNLSSVRFLGAAPSVPASTAFNGVDPRFVVYFEPESTGFSVPEWKGYPASPWIFSYTVNGDSVSITDAQTDVGGAVIIPSMIEGKSVTDIGTDAFNGCSLLTNITISSGVTNIEDRAFFSCSSLETILIPAEVAGIGDAVFYDCDKLTSIDVELGNQEFSSQGGVLLDESQTELVACPGSLSGSYTIPSGVLTIHDYALAGCDLLQEIMLPSGLCSIGNGALYGCPLLNEVLIPDSVINIGEYAFMDCSGLRSAYFLGNSPSQFGATAFAGTDAAFKLYYLRGSAGFTSPSWQGYPSVVIDQANYPASMWLLDNGFVYDLAMDRDLNGDGVELLMAYALNLNPNLDLSGSLPKPVIAPDSMSMSYYAGRSNVTYIVETSTDLETWTTNGVSIAGPDLNDELTASVDLDAPYRYFRLTVQQ